MTWVDQSGNSRDVGQSTASAQPTYNTTTDLINFNPTISFDPANRSELKWINSI